VTVFDRILIANRGEIAVRIMRTLRRMSIESIAVYSDADADALHVTMADEALRIGPAPARQSYLDIDRVVEAALASQAQAVHPGYGFLSENADFARACESAGLVFIGPRPDVIAAMGDKIAAKQIAIAAGVPVVVGRHDRQMDDATLIAAIAEIGFPALLKPAAGGGGKGMRVIREDADAAAMIASARRESRAAFGDDRLLVERYVDRPRHIEVQVLGDDTGRVVHLGERDCTLQRRHQKVIEEAPSTLAPDIRAILCESAVRLAASVGYTNAGTVEFVVPAESPADFAFLEMNTRLQVEHPVTEAVTGIDLVEQQIRIAAGEALTMAQDDIAVTGHAVEARIYAEDPSRGYLPSGGEIILWRTPDEVRVDSGVRSGSVVSGDYDPMVAKVIVHAPTRTQSLAGLVDALRGTVCLGVTTNIDDLAAILVEQRVVDARIDTTLLDGRDPHVGVLGAPALAGATNALLATGSDDLWSAGDAWRLGGPAWQRWQVGDHSVALRVVGSAVAIDIDGAPAGPSVVDAAEFDGERLWVHADGEHHALEARRPRDRRSARRHEGELRGAWSARSPMPGAVIAVDVAVGDVVEAGDPLAVVEAMKMEHALRAPARGTVTSVAVSPGARVALDAVLVEIEIEEQEGP
jgi:acetyl-CoA/propionyl-CoA carboxylase biotin carboxyl carrier protein